ncbi:MAG: DUF2341 domain-containing protein [bacterium]|nr:DUF2341 domain-containing protein [bacterium]
MIQYKKITQIFKISLLIVLFIVPVVSCSDMGSWDRIKEQEESLTPSIPLIYEPDWNDNIDITINAQTLGLTANVDNYPLLIRLDTANFPDIAAKTKSGGADIRFTDAAGETALSYEIENWSDNSSGTVWVLVDTISSSSPTTIRMYYNNPNAASESGPESVFETANGFTGVWHLGEDNADSFGTADVYSNSAGTGSYGADYVSSTDKSGIIGSGQGFDGSDDYIEFDTVPGSSANLTFELWLNSSVDNAFQRVISKHISQGTDGWVLMARPSGEAGYSKGLIFRIGCEDGSWGDYFGGWGNEISAENLYSAGEWVHVTGTYDDASGTGKLYVNGSKVAEKTNADTRGVANTATPLRIGHGTAFPEKFNGLIDELRVSNTVRSADWAKLSYETQRADQTIVVVD